MIRPTIDRATKCTLPEHFVYVAWKPGEPGARAACIDEEGYEEHLIGWMAEMVREGCKIQRMTCDQGHELLKTYALWVNTDDPDWKSKSKHP